MMRTCLILVGMILLITPVVADTDLGVTISPPAHLNTNAASDSTSDYRCRLASDGQGHWIAVWTGSNPTGPFGADLDIFVSQSINDGATWTDPGIINTDAQSDSRTDSDPAIASDGQGNWIVVWVGSGPGSGNDDEIFESHSADDGNSWSAPTIVNDQAMFDFWPDQVPFIATDRIGTWIVVWKGLSVPGPATTELLISRSTNNGLTWSPQAPLTAAPTVGNDQAASIATDAAGNWIAVWASDDSLGGTIGLDYDILYSVSSDGGANWSNPSPVSSNAGVDVAPDFAPSVATDTQGNWVVVWASPGVLPNGTSFSDTDILFARSTDNGANWSPVSNLDPNAATDTAEDSFPTVAASPYGGFIAIWESQDFSGSPYGDDLDLFGTRSFDGGITWSDVAPINTNATTDFHFDGSSTIASDGRDLTWIAVWQSDNDLMGMIGNDIDFLYAKLVADCNDNGAGDANEIHSGAASDCNDNHAPDECDIAGNASNDVNSNQIPDECETPCLSLAACNDGDVCTCNQCILGFCTSNRVRYGNTNCAGPEEQVNLDDILCSLAAFANSAACPNADIHPACMGNGTINLDDILAVLSSFAGSEPCNCLP